jgi:hypothetical protein
MDKKTFITIVVTALATTSITVLFRGLGLFAKSIITNESIRQIARKAFSNDNRRLIVSILVLGISTAGLVSDLRKPTALTRMEVFWLDVAFLGTCFWSFIVMFEITIRYERYKENKKSEIAQNGN